jgi:hypothetical protein
LRKGLYYEKGTPLSFIVLFSLMNFNSDVYVTILRAKSTLTFDEDGDGKVYTTGKVWVPKGGQLGVYGQNTIFYKYSTRQ